MSPLPPAMPWVKLYTHLLDDSRFSVMDDSRKWRYVQLLMLAGRLDAGGVFTENGRELTEEEIAWKLRVDAEILKNDLAALAEIGCTSKNGRGWCIPTFKDEQGPTQKDLRRKWKARQAKRRGKNVTGDNGVTSKSVTSDDSVTPARVTGDNSVSHRPRRRIRIDKDKDKEGGGIMTQESSSASAKNPPPAPAAEEKISPKNPKRSESRVGEPQKIEVVLSKSGVGRKPVTQSGYTNSHSRADAVTQFNLAPDERDAERVYCRVTDMPTFPPSIRAEATEIILSIMAARKMDVDAAVAYFRPIFAEYITRKNKATQQPYKKTGIGWLEIALGGQGPQPASAKLTECKLDCPVCHGLQVVRADVSPGHKLFGKMIPCPRRKPVQEAPHA